MEAAECANVFDSHKNYVYVNTYVWKIGQILYIYLHKDYLFMPTIWNH